jgi:hypothetical protein
VSSRIEADFFEPEEVRRRGERYEAATKALFSGLQLIQSTCEKGIKIAEQALRSKPGKEGTGLDREKTLAALDEINRSITGSEVREIAEFLLPTEVSATDISTQPGNTETALRSYLESSIRLYQSLANSANFI